MMDESRSATAALQGQCLFEAGRDVEWGASCASPTINSRRFLLVGHVHSRIPVASDRQDRNSGESDCSAAIVESVEPVIKDCDQPERASVRFLVTYVTRQYSEPDTSAFRLMGAVQSTPD